MGNALTVALTPAFKNIMLCLTNGFNLKEIRFRCFVEMPSKEYDIQMKNRSTFDASRKRLEKDEALQK
jgi:hypothetical protein